MVDVRVLFYKEDFMGKNTGNNTFDTLSYSTTALLAGRGQLAQANTVTHLVSCCLTRGGGQHLTTNLHTDGHMVGIGGDQRYSD